MYTTTEDSHDPPTGFTMPPQFAYYTEYDWTFNPRNFIGVKDEFLIQMAKDLDPDPTRFRNEAPNLADGEFDDIIEEGFMLYWNSLTGTAKDDVIRSILENIQIVQKKALKISGKDLLKKMHISSQCYKYWADTYFPKFDYMTAKNNLIKCGKFVDCAFENSDVCEQEITSSDHPYNAVLDQRVMSRINEANSSKAQILGITLNQYTSWWGHFPDSPYSDSVSTPYTINGIDPWVPGIDHWNLMNGQTRIGNTSLALEQLPEKTRLYAQKQQDVAQAEIHLSNRMASGGPDSNLTKLAENELAYAKAALILSKKILDKTQANVLPEIPYEGVTGYININPYEGSSNIEDGLKAAEDARKEVERAAAALAAAQAAASAAAATAAAAGKPPSKNFSLEDFTFEDFTFEKLSDIVLYIWDEYKIQSIVAIVVVVLLVLLIFNKSSPPPMQYIVSRFGKIMRM